MRTKRETNGPPLVWAHNLFVKWVFGFPTLGGSTYRNPRRQLLYLNSQTLNAIALLLLSNLPSPFLFFEPLLLPQLLLFIAQNQWKSMITLNHQQVRGSNSIASKWVFRWGWKQWHWNCFPPQRICLASIFPRYDRAAERLYNRAMTSFLRKQFIGCDPRGVGGMN